MYVCMLEKDICMYVCMLEKEYIYVYVNRALISVDTVVITVDVTVAFSVPPCVLLLERNLELTGA